MQGQAAAKGRDVESGSAAPMAGDPKAVERSFRRWLANFGVAGWQAAVMVPPARSATKTQSAGGPLTPSAAPRSVRRDDWPQSLAHPGANHSWIPADTVLAE